MNENTDIFNMEGYGCPHEIFVVASRPYAEKCVTAYTEDVVADIDGGFWLTESDAQRVCDYMNSDFFGPLRNPLYKVYKALLVIKKE